MDKLEKENMALRESCEVLASKAAALERKAAEFDDAEHALRHALHRAEKAENALAEYRSRRDAELECATQLGQISKQISIKTMGELAVCQQALAKMTSDYRAVSAYLRDIQEGRCSAVKRG